MKAEQPIKDPNTELEMLRQRVTELEQQTEQLQRTKRDLTERIKELDCLNELSRLSEDKTLSLVDFLQSVVNLLPNAHQRPESTWARLTHDQQEFTTQEFQETEWCHSSTIIVDGSPSGEIEVFTNNQGQQEGAPFLEEERVLLDNVAKSVGRRLERWQLVEALDQISSMLSKKPIAYPAQFLPDYGDLSQINEEGQIIKLVGKDQLVEIASDYLDLMGTSTAIYEQDGGYVLRLFVSEWCRMLDSASRKLCQAQDHAETLNSDHWLCQKSCWKESSLQAINTQEPMDIPCSGGISLYAVPILANNEAVGAINFGYGNPPRDDETLQSLSEQYQIPLETLRKTANAYQARPQFIIDYAKIRLNKAARYIGILMENVQTRKKLQSSRDNLSAIINASPLAIISIDPEGNVKTWNPAAERIFGWTEEEVLGQFLPTVGQGEMAEFLDLLEGYHWKNTTFRRDVLRTKKDGTKIMTRFSTAIIKNEDGKLESVIGILDDITEEIEIERKNKMLLNQQFAIHELTLNLGNAHDFLAIYRAIHQNLENILGIKNIAIASFSDDSESLKIDYFAYQGSMMSADQVPQISIANLDCPLNDVLQNKLLVYIPDWQKAAAAPDNTSNPLVRNLPFSALQGEVDEAAFKESFRSVVLVPIKDEDKLIGIIQVSKPETKSFSQDDLNFLTSIANISAISIQKMRLVEDLEDTVAERTSQLEDELQNSEWGYKAMLYMVEDLNQTSQDLYKEQENLKRLNQELEAFSYSVSHDLRAPLRHINGYIELLVNRFPEALPDKAQHYLNNIVDSVNEMGELIDDLLNFARTSRQEINPEEIDMNALVKEIIDTLQQDLAQRTIDWDIADLPQAFGDRKLIKLVWNNLLRNAIKFTRNKTTARITIGTTEENDKDVYFVRDNGVGFDMAYKEKLFGVFQRLHSSADFEGTGIGLANIRRIVERHRGQVWAEGVPDQGASFYFWLPKRSKNGKA